MTTVTSLLMKVVLLVLFPTMKWQRRSMCLTTQWEVARGLLVLCLEQHRQTMFRRHVLRVMMHGTDLFQPKVVHASNATLRQTTSL